MKGNTKHKNGSKSKNGAKKRATSSAPKRTAHKTNSTQASNGQAMDATELLMKDHENVQGLFAQFERASEDAQKKSMLFEKIRDELQMHTKVEEEIFYPAVRRQVAGKVMNEADEEHHVAKVLIAELEKMDGRDDHHDAKFTVLAENVRHHIKEEEGEMLPAAKSLDMDFDALGQKITHLEQQAADLRLQLEERGDELAAARAANRELMTRLNHSAATR